MNNPVENIFSVLSQRSQFCKTPQYISMCVDETSGKIKYIEKETISFPWTEGMHGECTIDTGRLQDISGVLMSCCGDG